MRIAVCTKNNEIVCISPKDIKVNGGTFGIDTSKLQNDITVDEYDIKDDIYKTGDLDAILEEIINLKKN